MLQYFINVSICWLVCLMLYDLWLRNEPYHQYNRMYLLLSLLAGLYIPTLQFAKMNVIKTNTYVQPTMQVYETNKNIAIEQVHQWTSVSSNTPFELSTILWLVYLIGIVVGVLMIVFEMIRIFRMYKSGIKSVESGCVIIETNQGHAPFSLFKLLFVHSKELYSPAQWHFLLNHEKEHARQRHIIDNVFLIILRIACWFNPLPTLYFKRLRLIHEFQADHVAATHTQTYGAFLLEQHLLQGAPSIAHSFNDSPIKKRIKMLLKSNKTSKNQLKYLSILPLFLILLAFCAETTNSQSASKQGDVIHFNGNEIGLGIFKVIPYEYEMTLQQQRKMFLNVVIPDSLPIKDMRSGLTSMQALQLDTLPMTLNGKKIYGNESQYKLSADQSYDREPQFSSATKNIEQYLFSQMQQSLAQLPTGQYFFSLRNAVLDEKGKLVYYEQEGIGIYASSSDESMPVIDDKVKKSILLKLQSVLTQSANIQPAYKGNQAVPVRLELGKYIIQVKDHKAQLVERGGC